MPRSSSQSKKTSIATTPERRGDLISYDGDGSPPAEAGKGLVELRRRDNTNPIGLAHELRWVGVTHWRFANHYADVPGLWSKTCHICGDDMHRSAMWPNDPCGICQETSTEARAEGF